MLQTSTEESFLDVPAPSRSLDGAPYAVPEGQTTGCWSLSIGRENAAHCSISEIRADGTFVAIASMPLGRFRTIAAKIDEDFNRRLQSNGYPAGSLPKRGGRTLMNAGFGRELAILFIACFDHEVTYRTTDAWCAAVPLWRRKLFVETWERMTADEVPQSYSLETVQRGAAPVTRMWRRHPQTAHEMLMIRAADGSEDPDRERAFRSRGDEAMAQIWAIRAKNPEWNEVLNSKTSWNRRRRR